MSQQTRCHLCAIIKQVLTSNLSAGVQHFWGKDHDASERLKLAVSADRTRQVCFVKFKDCHDLAIEVLFIYSDLGVTG